MHARSLTCVVALSLLNANPRAQSVDDLMRRVGDWVHDFVEQFANTRFRRFTVRTSEAIEVPKP